MLFRSGHGPDRGPDGDGRVPGPAGGHRPGPVQPGAAVLHGGQHGSHEVPQGAVGRRISDGVKKNKKEPGEALLPPVCFRFRR